MNEKKKVIYYNMAGDLDYENQLLQEWGIKDLELIQVTGNNLIVDVKEAESLTLEYTQVDADVMKNLPNLKIIALQSIGTDEIDIDCADREGIYVTNAPGFCAYEVASHVMALILNLNRKIGVYDEAVKNGEWAPFSGNKIERLQGQTVGLVSLGTIPKALIPMLKGFGFNVVFYSPSKTDEDAKRLGITRCDSLNALLNISDIVSLHTPLLPSTKYMINETTLAQMKEGAMLINTARGELIDESALIVCLKSNKISAAGLDVLIDEHNHDSKLIGMDNVIVTPHVGFLSKQSLLDARRVALEQIVTRLVKVTRPDTALNKEMLTVR
ncbi:C-terminal binding protein [Psychromonas arctica]|uniref:C-terminal binding protein n=1 Tax=Psychromonas arctica TaxID=168275 RepID=A0ABU9H9U8_9GAMM